MKNILFVCVENACRSQMAEAFANKYSKEKVNAFSAGSKPADKINPVTIEVLEEKGLKIKTVRPKGFEYFKDKKIDLVVSMGCGDVCPFVPADKHLHWDIENPRGKEKEVFRRVRDEIEEKVKNLIQEIIKDNSSS